MTSFGLWLLAALAVLVVATGLPVWALLVGVASVGALVGWMTGAVDAPVLAAIGPRIISLLEHDLLQALPLYVFVGVLLERLAVADALFATGERLFRPTRAGAPLSALAVGALIAPMNGSVASSSALLSRLVAPRLANRPAPGAVALISVAATIGVVVPPSLVLILLGDAMLRAHTEASNLPGFAFKGRIVNTQDVLHAALPPAALVLLLWALAAWARNRDASPAPQRTLAGRDILLAIGATSAILFLLGGVFAGRLFAVEAAAAGGCALALGAFVTRSLTASQWRSVLEDTLALSGALFALLVGATTFSLVFRIFGTDRWLAEAVLASPFPAGATAALVLLLVALCACALDAFEMIFVVVPIVAPLLIVQLGDARQVAVLLLFVLQLSFLLPPLGYAVLMTRARSGFVRVDNAPLLKALAPFLAAQVAVGALVFAWPGITHLLDGDTATTHPLPPSDADIVRQMEEMARQPEDAASAASQ